MAQRWRVVAATTSGTPTAELVNAYDVKLTARLDGPYEVTFKMDGRDPRAAGLIELSTDVLVYRGTTLMFRGRLGATSDDVSEDEHAVDYAAVDYRGLLARRTLWPTSTLIYATTDQSAIAWDLIADSQALTGGNLGIVRGVGATTGVLRDRSFDAGKSVADAIDDLAHVSGGFDWRVSATLGFDVYYPSRGSAQAFGLVYGSTVSRVRRQVDPSTFANAVRVSGADGVAPATREAAGLATAPEGRFETQEGYSDVKEATTVGLKADLLLAQSSVVVPSYVVTLNAAAGWTYLDLWLGDTTPLVVRSGRLNVDTTVRVLEVAITPGNDGEEEVEMTVGAPWATVVSRLRAVDRRLDTLERR